MPEAGAALPSSLPPQPRITVVGSFMQACVWNVPRLPHPGESLAADAFCTEPAGKGLAVAIGCHRLGLDVDLLLGVGRDAAGDSVLRLLADEGLRTEHVHRLADRSGHGMGMVDPAGENAIAVYLGANASLGPAHVQAADAALASSAVVYGQLEAPLTTVAAAFARGRAGGACTVLNPSPWHELPPTLMGDTQVLVVNQGEAARLLKHPLCMAAGDWREAWPAGWTGRWLVMTLGAAGSVALSRDGQWLQAPAFEVDAPCTVGAGDAFSAGLCAALARQRPMPEALRLGNACAALAVSRPGILAGLATLAEARALAGTAPQET